MISVVFRNTSRNGWCHQRLANVALWHLTEVSGAENFVRFTPNLGHAADGFLNKNWKCLPFPSSGRTERHRRQPGLNIPLEF